MNVGRSGKCPLYVRPDCDIIRQAAGEAGLAARHLCVANLLYDMIISSEEETILCWIKKSAI
jgi:hypothetical protein